MRPSAPGCRRASELTVVAKGILQSPYVYDTIDAERGRINATHVNTWNGRTPSSSTPATTHRSTAGSAGDVRHGYPAWSNFSFDGARNFNVPFNRTEYVGVGDARWFHVAWGSMTNDHIFEWSQQDPLVQYTQAGHFSDDWFGQPQHPGVIRTYGIGGENGEPVTRTGNTITGFIPSFMDAKVGGARTTPAPTARRSSCSRTARRSRRARASPARTTSREARRPTAPSST